MSSLVFQSTLPLRGATTMRRSSPCRSYFNPHSPCGERLEPLATLGAGMAFQSTLPLRGATLGQAPNIKAAIISIHTPLAGSDLMGYAVALTEMQFQSTLPLRGATGQASHPHGRHSISIHTPLAGSDATHQRFQPSGRDFNPHSPCGERRRFRRR